MIMSNQRFSCRVKMLVLLQDGFHCYGRLCTRHPLEVIMASLVTLTSVFLMSNLTLEGSGKFLNSQCFGIPDRNFTLLIDLVIRCAAVMNCYVQMKHIRKTENSYILGLSGLSLFFSSALLLGMKQFFLQTMEIPYCELLPYLLLLFDLSKTKSLLQSSVPGADLNLGQSLKLQCPDWTLDTSVVVMVLTIGAQMSASIRVQCTLLGLTFVAAYVSLLLVCPPVYSLLMQLQDQREGKLDSDGKIPNNISSNPVTQRVKTIMCAGLGALHIYRAAKITPLQDCYIFGTELVGGLDQCLETKENMSSWNMIGVDISMLVMAVILYGWHKSLSTNCETSSKLTPDETVRPAEEFLENKSEASFQQENSCAKENQTINEQSFDDKPLFCIGDESGGDACADMKLFPSPGGKNIHSQSVQTDSVPPAASFTSGKSRSLKVCQDIFKAEGATMLSNAEVMLLVQNKVIASHQLESLLSDELRAVSIRRNLIAMHLPDMNAFDKCPYLNYEYSYVTGACCENVIGYTPVPLGVAGPLVIADDDVYYVPMATTEGCLVASVNRGCKALQRNGVKSFIVRDGMTRAPVIKLPSVDEAFAVQKWLEDSKNFPKLQEIFNQTSRFASLQHIEVFSNGDELHIRFEATTGDAMGMNMVSKGSEMVVMYLQEIFPSLQVVALSGNCCTDKKPSAVNWVKGRGKSVVAEAVIPEEIVEKVLKTKAQKLVDANISKNLMGSALAGSIGGNNAQAANIVTAIYIATGQDPAQVVEGSMCLTQMKTCGETGGDLKIICKMPCIQVGTIGGGTVLPPQAACLKMLGVQGSCDNKPGANAQRLAKIVCSTVLAGELSLMSALVEGHLVKSHMKHNRSQLNVAPTQQ